MTVTARFIDVHILQALPFNNINRDDLGAPKQVLFGGATRTRVSSQCWKRATREHMQEAMADLPGFDPTMRTRRGVRQLSEALTARGWNPTAAHAAARVALAPYMKDEKDAGDDAGAAGPASEETDAQASKRGSEVDSDTGSVLLFLTQSQYDDVAAVIDANADQFTAVTDLDPDATKAARGKAIKDAEKAYTAKGTGCKKQVEEILSDSRGLVSVFGRMIASLPSANADAGVQVAHAFTTHETQTEFDYFSAVDDLNLHGDTGAGHIGTQEFSSGVYYRYATIDLADLAENTGSVEDTAVLAKQFLRSFIISTPSGKSNVTAPHTLPGLVAVAVRQDKPISYASAFETPVRSDNGHMLPSITAIAEHAALVGKVYGTSPVWSGHVNAATASAEVVGALTTAFGPDVDGGLTGLIDAAISHAGLDADATLTVREPAQAPA